MNFKTIIDVNYNRASEGLRVIDELVRHLLKDEALHRELKGVRHKLSSISKEMPDLVLHRESESDPGNRSGIPGRKDVFDLLKANFKRTQESLRVLEEVSDFKDLCTDVRFTVYDLEKRINCEFMRKNYDLENMGVYIVSDSEQTLIDCARRGARIIQLRDKKSGSKEILRKSREIKSQLDKLDHKVIFIVNDRPDIASLVDADGVHVGQDDMSVDDVRQIVGPGKIVGKSTHAIDQALSAVEEGADYIGVGPLWKTPTKEGRSAVGLEYLKKVIEKVNIPYVAIGGIDLDNVDQVVSLGCRNVAVVRAADDIKELIRKVTS